jgi:hypothetical protein
MLENEQREELRIFNEKWDNEFFEMKNKFSEQEEKCRDSHSQQLSQEIEEFEKNFPQFPKPSNDLLNLNKLLENAVRIKEYFIIFVFIF